MQPSAAKYYLSSIPTLLGGIHNALPTLLSAALTKREDRLVRLADGTKFHTRSLMDIWVIKETCLDRDYERIGAPIQDGWSVIDVGAGLGDFSVHVARRFPKARVIRCRFRVVQRPLRIEDTGGVSARSAIRPARDSEPAPPNRQNP